MNFAELKTELYARGTDYLAEDAGGVVRAERWLNAAYREILNLQSWPFLHTTVTSQPNAGALNIPDIRKVISVQADSRPLQAIQIEELGDIGVDHLTLPGSPVYWYLEGTIIRTYPQGGTLTVWYIKRVPPMSGTDTPIFSEEYHDLIVDGAMIRVYKDSDNLEAAAALRQFYDAGIQAMVEDYQLDTREPSFIAIETPYDG